MFAVIRTGGKQYKVAKDDVITVEKLPGEPGAVVEFGEKVSARAITAGGESGHPDSPHFNDEAERYTTGNLRTVYFWPEQLKGHTERVYHPGS